MDDTVQSFQELQSVIQTSGRGPRTKEGMVRVIEPKTGKVYEMTTPNARDKVRLDGWKLEPVVEAPTPVKKDEGEIPDVQAAPKSLDILDRLREEYAELAGKPADGRWGKKALIGKIALLKDS